MRGREHAYIGVRETPTGHVGMCKCMWQTADHPSKRSAQGAVAAHITMARETEAAPS